MPKSLSRHLNVYVDVYGAMIFSESWVYDGGKLQSGENIECQVRVDPPEDSWISSKA